MPRKPALAAPAASRKASPAHAPRAVKSRPPATQPAAYHHGNLREALVLAAEELLEEKGAEGFTLRECARRAGVSPAAPAHHFGNAVGLLTAVATLGFRGLSDEMEAAAAAAGSDPAARLKAICLAYLRFARRHPGRFRVVFGRFGLNWDAPEFLDEARRAFGILTHATKAAAGRPLGSGEGGINPQEMVRDVDLAAILGFWALPHGFAMLTLDGQFDFLAAGGPDLADRVAEELMGRLLRLARD